jgi:hypothetical protein
MTRRTLATITCVALIGAPAVAWSQVAPFAPQPDGEPVVWIGLFEHAGDGRILGMAVSDADAVGADVTSLVYLGPCGMVGASSNLRPPAAATDVWKLGGRLVSLDAQSAVVDVTWQRVREDGREVDDEMKSGAFQLRQGDRQTLASLAIPERGICPARTSTLDITYTRRPFPRRASGGGVTSLRVGRAGSQAGGAGGGIAANTATGAGVQSTGASDTFTVTPFARQQTTADLWLVHKRPGSDDQSQHLQIDVLPFPRASKFAQVTIGSPAGTFAVDVECDVETGLTPEGEPRLFISASRKITFTPAVGQARDRRPVVEGSIKTAVPRPGPNDVLEFELPAIEYPGAPAIPDRLSIRLKLTASKTE